jgi:ribose 5-phosphate isomerase B
MDDSAQVFVGSDHAGFELKTLVLERLRAEFPQAKIQDCGPVSEDSVDYPKYAEIVGKKVVSQGGVGILICGSGIGMSISANKVNGVRAAMVWDTTSARLSRQHNGANIVCIGARLTGRETAFDIVRTFLKTPFEGGRHAARVELITKLEQA